MQEIDRDKLYTVVGANIRYARERHIPKFTQSELAKLLDVERTSITNIEKGTQRATLLFLYGVAQKLGVPLSVLLPPVDDPTIKKGLVTSVAEIVVGKRTRTVPAQIKSVYDKV